MKEKVSLFLNPRPWHKVLRDPWGLYIHMSMLSVHLCVCVSMWYAHDCMSFVCARVQAFVHMFSHVWLYTCKCLYAHVGVSVCVHIFWRPWEPSLKVVEISNLGAGFWLCLQVAGSASRSLSTSLGLWQFLEAGLPWNLGSGKLFLERASCSVFYSLQGTHSFCWISFFFFNQPFKTVKRHTELRPHKKRRRGGRPCRWPRSAPAEPVSITQQTGCFQDRHFTVLGSLSRDGPALPSGQHRLVGTWPWFRAALPLFLEEALGSSFAAS